MRAIDEGKVAVRSTNGRVLLHFMKPDLTPRTICGRYPLERILPEDEELHPKTGTCQVCQAVADGTNNQRWRQASGTK